jgi:hypothetical protein
MITGIAGLVASALGLAMQYGAGTQKQAAFESDRRVCLHSIYDFSEATENALHAPEGGQERLNETFQPVLYSCLDSRMLDSESGFVLSWVDLHSLTAETPGGLFGSEEVRAEALSELWHHNAMVVDYLRALDGPSPIQLQPTRPGAPDTQALGFDYSRVCGAIVASVSAWMSSQEVGIIPASIGKYHRLCDDLAS